MMQSIKLQDAPRIFDYVNVSAFVRDRIDFLKSADSSFSFRKFAKRIGFASPGHVHMIMGGQAALSEKSAMKLAVGFELNKSETKAFLELIEFEKMSEGPDKIKLRESILAERMKRKKTKLKEHQFAYFTCWYYPVIRELVGLSDFKLDKNWIAKKLVGGVTPAQVGQALQTLLALELIRSDGKDMVQSEPSVETEDYVSCSELVPEFHRSMMAQAQAAQTLSPAEREISGLTITLNSSEFEGIRAEVLAFRDALFTKYGQAKPDHNSVYQFNLQLFPLTK